MLGQFLHVPWNFEISTKKTTHIRKCEENTLWPEIWWHDAVYHETDHYRRVQSYSRDMIYKMDWTVQSPKLSYSEENSSDSDLQFPLYIDINRSNDILWLLVKFEKGFWKHLRIYCA